MKAIATFDPELPVRVLLEKFPQIQPALAAHGLDSCCGGEHSLRQACAAKGVPLEEVLREFKRSRLAPSNEQAKPVAFSPHFLIASLALTLTLGATTGAVNLVRIAAGGDVPIDHRQIHGHTQILGFAAMFLMGIAYHALPRVLGLPNLRPAGVRPAFWLMLSGVLLRNLGQPFGFFPWGRAASLSSAGLEIASGLLFARFVFTALNAGQVGKYDRSDALYRFVRAGTVYFVIALALLAAQGIWLAGHVETALPVSLCEPFYFVSLYGFLLAWIYGFGSRMVSMFLGTGPARKTLTDIALRTQLTGTLLALFSWLPVLPDAAALALRDAGLALTAVSALAYLAGLGFLWRHPAFPAMRAPGAPTVAIRTAFGFLGLWAVLELAGILLARTTAVPAQNLWWSDAARHVFSIGFLTLLIVGMSIRVLPVFTGKRLWSPRLAYATYALLVAGAAMRLLQYPAAFRPVFYEIGSYMGIPVVLALVFFSVNLVRTVRARPAAPLAVLPVLPMR
jgi:uncharacterized protein involved in response to NO